MQASNIFKWLHCLHFLLLKDFRAYIIIHSYIFSHRAIGGLFSGLWQSVWPDDGDDATSLPKISLQLGSLLFPEVLNLLQSTCVYLEILAKALLPLTVKFSLSLQVRRFHLMDLMEAAEGWETLRWLSMRTTHVSEQPLSAFPGKQHKLLNISNLLRQLSQWAFLSSVSQHAPKWRRRCSISKDKE